LREYNADLLLSAFFVFASLAAIYCGTYQETAYLGAKNECICL